ncbi:hypothetical protein PYCCODRAFT_73997 [Trametes coccinea BRFM310]|uniref:Uncharacterized protein n=1 Tax=Trametes coccinea (strain BRFM310) TaxID=1353009 RepID=A0A1Y2IUP4_TRAC3|nr:hypothetical protein PYCCODRAFT_73997 [Trametes coccinea BRFM310]
MIDGPATDVPLGTRLEQLRAYQASWREGNIPTITVESPKGTGVRSCPASAFSGIAAAEVGTVDYAAHIEDPEFELRGVALDREQDLVVLTKLVLGEIPQMYFLSISQGGAFHPLAAQPVFEDREELGITVEPEERIEICGDLVAWTVRCDVFSATVLNWKTGAVVWSDGEWLGEDPHYYISCHFLDDAHFVAVQGVDIHIYAVNPAHSKRAATALCRLQLPALQPGILPHFIESEMRPPPNHAADNALFQRDPALTLLAVRFSACKNPYGYDHAACKSFIALVPAATLSAAVQQQREAKAPPAAVPWEAWSTRGARLLECVAHTSYHMHMSGSACMLVPSEPETEQSADAKKTLLLDARPLARDAPCAALDMAAPPVKSGACIDEPACFVRPVRNTLPYRILEVGGAPDYRSHLSHDAVVTRVWK